MESLVRCSQKFENKISWNNFLIRVLSSKKPILSIDLPIVPLGAHLNISQRFFPLKTPLCLSISTVSLIYLCVHCSIAVPTLKSRAEGPIALAVFCTLHTPYFRIRTMETN